MHVEIRQIDQGDRNWVREFVVDHWAADCVVVHGTVYYPHLLSGFIATNTKGDPVGLATYVIENGACEIVTLDSVVKGEGVGSAMIEVLIEESRKRGCRRLWCITTNDNLPALGFYQRRGFRLVAVYPGAVEKARVLKPSIPLLGSGGIPIHDEIELELNLSNDEHR
jgi:ribosomal protein S18 acetylase RimI-like enzyme